MNGAVTGLLSYDQENMVNITLSLYSKKYIDLLLLFKIITSFSAVYMVLTLEKYLDLVMNNITRIIILGGLVAIGGAYAGGVFNPWLPDEMKVGTSKASVTGESDVDLAPEDIKLEEKLQPVIACLNNVAGPLRQAVAGYSQDYPNLLETTGSTRGPWRFKLKVYEQNNEISRDCVKGLRDAIAMTPADAGLDVPSKTFADTLEALIPVMNDADTYYSRNENVDDAMKKGKELDDRLRPLFDTFLSASDQLNETVSDRNLTLRERRLAAMEKAIGKENFSWHMLNVSIASRRAMDNIMALADSGKLDEASVEAIEREYQTAFDNADAFAKAHPDVKTTQGNMPVWFSLASDFNNFLAQIKEFRRLVAKKASESEIDFMLSKLLKEYNHTVRNYNMIGTTRS